MFTAVSLLLLIADSLFNLFLGFTMLLQALNCLKRVEEFILTPLPRDGRITNIQDGQAVSVQNGSFGWSEKEPPCVKSVSFAIPKGEVVFLLGPVASGKSTLLHALLGETPLMEGSVAVSDKEIAFCGQSPWLMVRRPPKSRILFSQQRADIHRTPRFVRT
jgi:ABC-type multidrug transport system fused ATPase/permease subunit